MKFSIVIPCHNEEDSIGLLLDTLKPLLIAKFGKDWEVILVDDGSRDSTRNLIQTASDLDRRIKGVFLSRAFGHQPAIFAGLGYATGAYVGVIDVDLQDPPSVLLECLEKATAEKLDVVYAVRRTADESNDLWSIFNRIQENILKGGKEIVGKLNSKGQRRRIVSIRGIDQEIRVNQELWLLAEQMALIA
jgi:glycosyltransferase involved in cell wall biosynthesis